MPRKIYPSDITREQFEFIRPALESFKKKTKPKTVDSYEVFCALLYVVKSGCQWRMLPSDFPDWKLVYYYFTVWGFKETKEDPSLLEKLLKKIGSHRAYETWKNSRNQYEHCRRSKREEH